MPTSASKIFVILIALVVTGVVYQLIVAPAPPKTVNAKVNDEVFNKINCGMREAEVESLLDLPSVTRSGEIVCIERPEATALRYSIEPGPQTTGGNVLNIYEGQDDENIRVLLSAADHTVIAVEYCIADKPVLYKGGTGQQSRAITPLTLPRVVSLTPEQDAHLKAYHRRKELQGKEVVAAAPAVVPAPIVPVNAPSLPVSPSQPAAAPGSDPTSAVPAPQFSPPNPPFLLGGTAEPGPGQAPMAAPAANQPWNPSNAMGGFGDPQPAGDKATHVQISLPSGAQLTEALLSIPDDWPTRYFPEGADVYVGQYPEGGVQGVFTLDRSGKLQGPAATLYQTGQVQTLASYRGDRLDGAVHLWDENRRRILYVQYKRDSKQGLLCYFREGQPWLIQTWEAGELGESCLVKMTADGPRAFAVATLEGEDLTEVAIAQQLLDDLEAEMAENAIALKKVLRAEVERIRREKIAALAPERRERTRQRDIDRRAGQAAQAGAFWRTVLKQSW